MTHTENKFALHPTKHPLNNLDVAVIDIDEPVKAPRCKSNTLFKNNASEVVCIARKTFNTGKTKSIPFRKKQLKNLLRLLEENSEDFVKALEIDLGRHRMESLVFDVDLCKHEVIRMIWHVEEWAKPIYPSKPPMNLFDKLYICNDPYGVVLVIGAWNFPVNLLLGPTAGAIAAGNCVVIKPSEIPATTEKLIFNLIPKYLDNDCYQVYTGGAKETAQLLEQRFDYIFFTGSPNIGRIVHAAANKHLTPVTLELGGKNPVYLDDTVDMEQAVKRIFFGKCSNAGQICMSPDYLLCTQEVQTKFIEAAKKVLHDWYGSDLKSSPDYGKIVSERHWNRLTSFIEDKHTVAVGGRSDIHARFIDLTIITGVDVKDSIMQEEIFGPILPVITVEDVNEAVRIMQDQEKPLVLYIFSNDSNIKEFVLNNSYSGGVVMNDTLSHFVVDTLPFGGVGLSGMGRYHGKDTFDTFVHKKSVLDKDYTMITEYGLSFRNPPYTNFKYQVLSLCLRPIRLPSSETVVRMFLFFLGILLVVMFQVLYYQVMGERL